MTDTDRETRMLFVGDTYFGENYVYAVKLHSGVDLKTVENYRYFYQHFARLFRESAISIANLEATLTPMEDSPFRGVKQYVIRGNGSKTMAALKDLGIAAVSLANNHTRDFGAEGLEDTQDFLRDSGIEMMGAGVDGRAAAQPFMTHVDVGGQSLKVIIVAGYEYNGTYAHAYDFYARKGYAGVHMITAEDISEQIAQLRTEHPEAFIIAYPHWGRNYKWRSNRQTGIAHAMVDAGANLILGHGAHAMQEIECHEGVWIAYSLGNFIFNTPGRYELKSFPPYSFVAQVVFELEGDRIQHHVRFYPMVSDNRLTAFQPRLVNAEEFKSIQEMLHDRNQEHGLSDSRLVAKRDAHGFFLETGDDWLIRSSDN